MSIDPSLKSKGKLVQKRSVMTRPERVEALLEEKRLSAKNKQALGLPKTKVREG